MTITYDEFRKIELRTARILEVEDIPGKDKLYKLSIEVGSEKRTLVAGIKQWYSKEELKGKMIVIVANLEPKTLGGIESQGMLLAVDDANGNFSLVVAERPIDSGAAVR
ncbi:MAG: methionine--tRNA ligase subunit beta [Candidatus Diapherotrites archaeon]|nr:methionine--tRNA ligase subunit beta [Candidatus Diapherotrites archaeon]